MRHHVNILACLSLLATAASGMAQEADGSEMQSQNLAETTASVLPDRAPHKGVEENMFQGHSWYTPPPPPPPRPKPKAVKRAPVAPPLPFKLLGSYDQKGVPTTYYLVKGDRVYDVVVGDKLENTYTIDGVTNGELMFTYLPLKTSQGLRLGEKR